MSFMNVLLPAPFGPSRPVMPGGTLTVTSFRPMTWPYHFERCSAVRIGALTTTTSTPRTRRSSTEIETHDQPDQHEHRDDHRRVVARRLPEHHVGDVLEIRA